MTALYHTKEVLEGPSSEMQATPLRRLTASVKQDKVGGVRASVAGSDSPLCYLLPSLVSVP